MWEGQWAGAAVSSHSTWAWPSICSAVCHGAGVVVWGGGALECCGVPRGTHKTYLRAGSAWDCDEWGPRTSRVCWGDPPPLNKTMELRSFLPFSCFFPMCNQTLSQDDGTHQKVE